MPIDVNEVNTKSRGGTELMVERLNRLPAEILAPFQIIPSRVRSLDDTKVRILWLHDLPGDPESEHLKNGGWAKFHKLVFVSYWQRDAYINHYKIPYNRCTVIRNCIDPIQEISKPTDQINIIYHTTPHRGLKLLVPTFLKLAEKYDNIHLDVYSSFKIYGWDERDKEYSDLFNQMEYKQDRIHNHGTVSIDQIRAVLAKKSHIFSYPSVWPETSCLSLIEAMSAKCIAVHPSYAALPETAAGWTLMYDMKDDHEEHQEIFYHNLEAAIMNVGKIDFTLNAQKSYVDTFYSWEYVKNEWTNLLRTLKDLPTEIEEPKQMFIYRT